MTLTQIKQRVQKEADDRFGETIDRLFVALRNRHTHQCWSCECFCEYCRFIRTDYVAAKLRLQRLKIMVRRADDWEPYDIGIDFPCSTKQLAVQMLQQKETVRGLKQYKKSLQTNVI